jgi:hypothetical protein
MKRPHPHPNPPLEGEGKIIQRSQRMREQCVELGIYKEVVPLLRGLVDAGLADGWRNVSHVGTRESRPSVPAVVFRREDL